MIQGLSAIPYMGAVALGKAVGVTTAGLSAMEISNAVTQKIKDNPELLNDPRFKAAALTFGINVPGYIAPNADEIEKVRKEIQEGLKPAETSSPIDQGPIVLGGSEPPKIETTEKFPAAEEVGPIKEQFPNLFNDMNKAVITYSKDVPKDFKDLAKRSVGKEKGTEAAEALFDDDIFENTLETRELMNIRNLEDRYVGDILDRGDPSIPLAFTNSMMKQYEPYFEDYKEKLAEVAKEKLGNEFPMFRLMKKDDALKMLINQELPTIKKLDEDTDEVVPFTINMFGENVEMLQENMSFTLNPRTALGFKEIFDSEAPDEDFVLIEMKASPSDIVMRGHSGETDLVLNMSETINSPQIFKLYDFKYKKEDGKIKGLDVSENKEFKDFLDRTKKAGIQNLATRELEEKISKEKDLEDKKAIESLKKVNEFYDEKIKKSNEENPNLRVENLPKLVEADKHFGAAANSFEGFEESQLIYMSPQKYLDLTKDYRPKEQSKLSKVKSDNIKNLLKEGKELANYPYLYVKKSGNDYEVSGQEGIHRAIAFKELGYDEIPVVIQGVGKDQLTGLENKVFTATPRSYLYKQPFTQEHIGFIPERITSNEESFKVMPDDIREVKSKQKLFNRVEKAMGGMIDKPLIGGNRYI